MRSPLIQNVPLTNKTTFRIGGYAQWYTEPSTEQELTDSLSFAKDKDLPVFILGKGSNVLVSDTGWPGLVINLSQKFNRMEWNGTEVHCESGALLTTVVADAVRMGLGGAEELAGIPGTIGGGVIMNAGAYEDCIADVFIETSYIDLSSKEIISCSKSGMCFGYRSSLLHGKKTVVLNVRLGFSEADSEMLMKTRERILALRKQKQPLDLPNCGSVFKRPPGKFAGTLIESCGLKGLRIGAMEISPKHANFIVNHGTGTARDVRRLIYKTQETVFEKTGVLLEPEVLFVGDFDEPLYEPKNRSNA